MTKDEIIKYVMTTPENTNPAILREMLDELSQGGGSSDFSIAYLTVTNLNPQVNTYIKITDINEQQSDTLCHITNTDELSGQAVVIDDSYYIVPVILYHGYTLIKFDYEEGSNPVITGNLESIGSNEYIITGDCTFSANGVSGNDSEAGGNNSGAGGK